MKKYCFGADIGGTTVKLGLFDIGGELIEKWEIPTRTENAGEAILPDIAASIDEKITDKNIDKEEVLGIGLCAPGPVEDSGLIHRAVNLGWGYINIRNILSDLSGLPVVAGNDANVAALGEMWKGGGMGYDCLVMVTLGTGVGGGIINNSKILTGSTGAGGEIGHIHIQDGETEACGCGNYGCLEQYASATGITRLANRRLAKDNKDSILRNCEVNAKTVFDAVKNGDEVAVEIAETFGEYLGKGLAVIAAVCNPELFVIGGGVSKAGNILFEYIEPNFNKYAFHGSRDAKFSLAKLGNDAGIYGAAKLVIDEVSK